MADVYRYRWGEMVDRWVKKTGTVAVQLGDMLRYTSSGKVTPVTASTDAQHLMGISLTKSPTTDKTNTQLHILEIGHGTVFEMICTSGDYDYGDVFAISGAQTLTKKSYTNPLITSTNVVAMCAQDMDGTGTSVLVSFLPGRPNVQITTS